MKNAIKNNYYPNTFFAIRMWKEKKVYRRLWNCKKRYIIRKSQKIPEDKLAKIETPLLIDLDTVVSKHQTIKFEIKNISKNILRIISIKPFCECVSISNYNKEIKPFSSLFLYANFYIENQGYFTYSINIYGTFYPFKREIKIEGYKK